MESDKFGIIQQLMEQLQGLMGDTPDELGERLGREKPAVEVLEIESNEPMEGSEEFATDGDLSSPEEKLTQRLLKLRG